MSSSPDSGANTGSAPHRRDVRAVLAREAGLPVGMASGRDAAVDPIAEWLSLMEVVQMLCPVWPVRDQPMQGDCWWL